MIFGTTLCVCFGNSGSLRVANPLTAHRSKERTQTDNRVTEHLTSIVELGGRQRLNVNHALRHVLTQPRDVRRMLLTLGNATSNMALEDLAAHCADGDTAQLNAREPQIACFTDVEVRLLDCAMCFARRRIILAYQQLFPPCVENVPDFGECQFRIGRSPIVRCACGALLTQHGSEFTR